MAKIPFNLELYAVTDRTWLRENAENQSLETQVEQALRGGATLVQIREKTLSTRDFIGIAANIKRITDSYGVPLIINDRLDVALAIDAAGLHVGQDDMPAATARKLLGPDKILGVSVVCREQALKAQTDGADYLGAGAVFPTETKTDADFVNYHELQAICAGASIPVVAIGGIQENNATKLRGSGIKGIAVVSALFGRNDIENAARVMRKLAGEVVG